jgi:small subunit ribosomal protein S14
MAKTSATERNSKRKRLVAQYAEKRARLKAIARDPNLPVEDRFVARLKLSKLPRNSAAVRVRNRCELTGRPRGYEGTFRLSRIALRELASRGQIPGMTKSSW